MGDFFGARLLHDKRWHGQRVGTKKSGPRAADRAWLWPFRAIDGCQRFGEHSGQAQKGFVIEDRVPTPGVIAES
jgi:hypothetical protein